MIQKIVLHILIPLFFGCLIYLFWRGVYLFEPYFIIYPVFIRNSIPCWLLYNLPDAIWFYSFLSSIAIIFNYNVNKSLVGGFMLAFLLAFGLELCQNFNFIPGTFDFNDILAYIISALFFLLNLFYYNLENSYLWKRKNLFI